MIENEFMQKRNYDRFSLKKTKIFPLKTLHSTNLIQKQENLEQSKKIITSLNVKHSERKFKLFESPVKLFKKEKHQEGAESPNLPFIHNNPDNITENNISSPCQNSSLKYFQLTRSSIEKEPKKRDFSKITSKISLLDENPNQIFVKRGVSVLTTSKLINKRSKVFVNIPMFSEIEKEDNQINRENYSSQTNDQKLSLRIDSDEEIEKITRRFSTISNNSLYRNHIYQEEKNTEFKSKMEDFYRVYTKSEDQVLFSIYDGHGGDTVAKFVRNRLPEVFFAFASHLNNNYLKAFAESFRKIDQEMMFSKAQIMGTTATLVLLIRKDSKRYIYCANVGDSRCLLISDNKFQRITFDHKCTDQSENERIRESGGSIINGRINGYINLSRSLGDLNLKSQGLISNPYLFEKELTDEDKFLVLASDGVWDVTSDRDVYNISKESNTNNKFCEEIVNNSLRMGSEDNISCLTVQL